MGAGLPLIVSKKRDPRFLIKIEKSNLKFKVKVTNQTRKGYTISFALLANGLESNIKSGENRGRILKHNFVVLDLKEVALSQTNEFSFEKPILNFKSLSYADDLSYFETNFL